MKINLKEMGERIKGVRGQLTLEDFGKIVGISRSMVSKYENGDAWPKPETLGKIIEFGRVSYDWILMGKLSAQEPEPAPKTYILAEDEERALHTAEDLLERYGLEKRFAVTEIHHPPSQEEKLNDDEKELLEAFRLVDQASKTMLLQVANNAALAFRQGGGRNRPEENGSPAANCA